MALTDSAVEIRVAGPDDVPSLATMGARFLAWSPYGKLIGCRVADIEAGITNMMAGGALCLVAYKGDALVGGLLGLMSEMWFRPGLKLAVELGWWVDPEHRGSVGIRLLRRFEAYAIEQGAGMIALSDMVVDGTEPADRLFRSLGYTSVERSHVKEC